MTQRTKYQEKIIKNYYKNQDEILLQRVSDYVTDLFLAEGKSRQRIWKNISGALEKLKVPASRIENLVKKDDPQLLAGLLKELLDAK
jgi:hypothetical protein